jgi:tetratricopeptide (TPR) repeat protein
MATKKSKKAAPKKASPKRAVSKRPAPKKAVSKRPAPKKAAPKKTAPKKAAAKAKKVAPRKKPPAPLVFALPPERLGIEDVKVEQDILFNAPWDMEPVAASEEMAPAFLAHLGAARFRRGELAEAERAWAAIAAEDKLAEVVRPWRALALARMGQLEAALALAPEGQHLRGEILCALGRFDEGLAVIEKGREGAELIEWRALREGHWLRRAGRPAEAGARLEKRLEKIARSALRLRLEAMRAWLDAGQPERARPHFEVFESDAPGAARALAGASLEGLAWLPHGLASLAAEAAARGVDIHFVDRKIGKALVDGLETGPTAPMGVLPGRNMWPALAEGRDFVAVAQSFTRPTRMAYAGATVATWLAHPERPGKLYLCLNPRIPAFLWPEVDASVEAIARTIAPYREELAVDEPRVSDLPCRLRLFIGASAVPSPYSGELEEMDFHTFARVAVSSPFLESYGWGGEHTEDPHAYFVDRGGLDGMLALRRTSGQDPERPLVESYRTQHSRSIFSLELHRAGWVVDVRYRPSPHAEQTRASNARFGTRFPDDLPLDCYGLLMHFDPAFTAEDLMASITPDLPADQRWRIYAVGALLHESIALDEWLARLPEALAMNADEVAWIYGHLGYLLRRATERADLHGPLQAGPGAVNLRPPEGDEDDADEEEDES